MSYSNHDAEYLERCREMIEQKLGWRPAAEWRNYEFTELSEKILEATNVHLSATTLKRVFGKIKYDSLPSSVTLNALANYIGFPSWMEFKSQPGNDKEILQPVKGSQATNNIKKWTAGVVAVCVCAVVAFLILSGKSSPALKNAEAIVFNSKPLANGLPNSVVFNVDLKGNKPNNIIIQQSWDSTKTVRLQRDQTEATGIYYFPGYFRAKLILDGKIVKEHDLFIKSDKWMATIDHKPIPTYVKENEIVFEKGMNISESLLPEIKKINTPTYQSYHLVKPFGSLQSDDFILETSIKNTFAEGPAVCKTVKIYVLCSKGAFIIPVTIPGCASDINLMANDRYLNGKSNDLSAFTDDLLDWLPVKLEVKNRIVKIFFNNKLIREETYQNDAGEVVGIRFSFIGAGAVNYVTLWDKENRIVYSDDFK